MIGFWCCMWLMVGATLSSEDIASSTVSTLTGVVGNAEALPTISDADVSHLLLPLSAVGDASGPPVRSEVDASSRCFAVWQESCPPISEICRCRPVDAESAVCCDISRPFQLAEGLGCESVKNLSLSRLHLWNVSLPDLDSLSKRGLSSLTVSGSHIRRIRLSGSVSCLNVSGNTIDEMPVDSFRGLNNLEFVSLANLTLSKLPHFKTNVTLDLMGNLSFKCSVLSQYMHDYPFIRFVNENSTFCLIEKIIGWINTTENISLEQTKLIRDIEEGCVPGCRCSIENFHLMPGENHFTVKVNCSAGGLTELPPTLPQHVTVLDVSNNSITSLDRLIHDVSYKDVSVFNANANKLTSILPLEGSDFIARFQVLSLTHNQITSLPTYIFSNTLDRIKGDKQMYLGFNKLTCNCSVAHTVKPWLVGNRKFIPDYDLLSCSNMPDTRVIDLDPNKVCVDDRDWTDYIYFIIAGEVILLVLLVGKVSYDYWVFKTAGYLPWPASKMPKLPCDWVFE